jgi:hypothetical protein
MQIRDLKWRALPMWPPEWFISYHGAGEAGMLEDVQFRKDIAPELIIIVANYEGESRKGIVILEDHTQLEILFHKIKDNIGKDLSEIGELEIDFISSSAFKGQKQVRFHSDCYQTV